MAVRDDSTVLDQLMLEYGRKQRKLKVICFVAGFAAGIELTLGVLWVWVLK